ncbi:hypothetical protein G9A89_021746 [Geosiphon pyriformis]|nr:hypothetical protein G9A89_021746 [Geosiphon pyriformis]
MDQGNFQTTNDEWVGSIMPMLFSFEDNSPEDEGNSVEIMKEPQDHPIIIEILTRTEFSVFDISKISPLFQNLSEQNSKILADFLSYYYQLSYVTGDDVDVVCRMRRWLSEERQSAEFLFELVKSQSKLSQCASLLGYLYNFGIGTKVDEAKALEWYEIAAKCDDSFAANQAGYLYCWGIGTKKNLPRALMYFEQSAQLGDPQGHGNLAYAYLKGAGVPQDQQKAFLIYQKAAESDAPVTFLDLAGCYRQGLGVGKDESKAVFWYHKAAYGGNLLAQNELGFCYLNSIGIPKNYRWAKYWFTKSGEGGHMTGQFNVGYCYENRVGTMHDMHAAFQWYKKATQNNHNGASLAISRIFDEYHNLPKTITELNQLIGHDHGASTHNSTNEHEIRFIGPFSLTVPQKGDYADPLNILISQFQETDCKDIYNLLRPENPYSSYIHKWTLRIPNPYTLDNAKEFISLFSEINGNIIQESKYSDIENMIEIGYYISGQYQNRGIMTAAVKFISDEIAFNGMGKSVVRAIIFDGNIGSAKVLEKAGFVKEAFLPGAYLKNGERLDVIKYLKKFY